jgi:selenocysteine lyase/cysteine desulfurase
MSIREILKRRDFLRLSGLGAFGLLSTASGCASDPRGEATLDTFESEISLLAGGDEEFWRRVRAYYTLPDDHLDLDHANTAPTPRPVFAAFVERARRLSAAPSSRFGEMWQELDEVTRPAVASYVGAEAGEVMFMANTTAALNTVLRGFPLQRGDEILVTNHEYPDMVESVVQRVERDGVVMRTVRVPEPDEDPLALVGLVTEAITPRTKLLLISHVSAWSGEVLPVTRVTAAARERGVAVLVDAAQSVGIIDVNFRDIGCDFLGASFHKGVAAPLPTGVLIMRREQMGRVAPLHPPSWESNYPTDLYEWSGTFNVAGLTSVSDALRFQRAIGSARKLERLRFLSTHWQDRLRELPGVRTLTPRVSARWCGPAAFAVDGVPSKELAKSLRAKHRIIVQDKTGRYSPFSNAIRVSPPAHATLDELDRFVAAVADVTRAGAASR